MEAVVWVAGTYATAAAQEQGRGGVHARRRATAHSHSSARLNWALCAARGGYQTRSATWPGRKGAAEGAVEAGPTSCGAGSRGQDAETRVLLQPKQTTCCEENFHAHAQTQQRGGVRQSALYRDIQNASCSCVSRARCA